MSTDNTDRPLSSVVKEAVRMYGHIYALALIALIAFYTRLQGWERLSTEGGSLALLGNDPWYHYRATSYTVENWPWTLGIDPKTGYPEGSYVGTFNTLYDQVHATIALIIGLGDPSSELIRQLLAISSPVLTMVTAVAVYLLAKYVTDSRWAGVTAAGILVFIPGTFYERGVVGFAGHHIAESLLLVVAVLVTMKALDQAENDIISWDVIAQRERGHLNSWMTAIGVGAAVILIYYLTWPPAMMYFGLLAAAAGIYALITYPRSIPTEPALVTFAGLLAAAVLFVLIQIPELDTSVSKPSLLHLGVAGAAFSGTAFVAVVNRIGTERGWSMGIFAGVTLGVGALATLLLSLVQPELWNAFYGEVVRMLGYPFGLGGERVHTIAEEQPTSLLELSLTQYGLTLATAIVGMVAVLSDSYSKLREGEGFASNILLVVVGVFLLVISLRTIRFNYYLAPFVGVFTAIAIHQLVEFVGIPETFDDIKGYHVITMLIIVTCIVPVLVVPTEGAVYDEDRTPVVVENYDEWEEPLMWLSENSPDDSIPQYESSESQPPMYNDGAYGVVSWWDYGHWITVTGERTPVANPFQQHATEASEFLLADDPDEANAVINELNEDLETDVRYVAIDWQMASPLSKYPAITEFNDDVSYDDTTTPYFVPQADGSAEVAFLQREQLYYESLMVRMYLGHGSHMEPGNTVVDYNTESAERGDGTLRTLNEFEGPVKTFETTEEAQEYADNETEVAFSGLGANPQEPVDALENYRLVKSSSHSKYERPTVISELAQIDRFSEEDMTLEQFAENPSAMKLFEHVPGSDIEGDNAPAGETVIVSVQMFDSATEQPFTYEQHVTADEHGEFTATVPYSTTAYDENPYAPEVQAMGPYTVQTDNGDYLDTAHVPETSVIEDDTEAVTVSLEESEEADGVE